MVHVGNLRRPVRHDACGGGARVAVDDDFCSNGSKSSPHSSLKLNSMDEPPSPSNTQEEEDAEGEGGKREQHDVPSSSTADWLQLGLGTSSPAPAEAPTGVGRRQALTELQLFTDRPSSSWSAAVPWRSLSMPAAQFARRPGSGSVAAAEAEAGQSGMRVVSPPRRQAGVWLMLQAAQTQGRQHFLAQIPRNYLRIKNERMTIRLMMRYLASKLSLEDESEVEITCRDQLLLPSMTLQYVRDNIWYSGDAPPVLPDSPSIDHVMTLQYRRSTSTSQSH